MEFFTVVYNYVFVLELLAVSVSLLIVFYPFKRTVESFVKAALHLVVLFAAGTLLNWGLFSLSTVWHFLGGINFHLSWLIMIVAYLCFNHFINRIYLISRMIMGATLFVSVIAMCDLGLNMGFAITGKASDLVQIIVYLLIVGYSIVISKFSLKNYSDISTVSVVIIMINAVASTALIIVKTVINTISHSFGQEADVFYILTLFVIYIVTVSSYMLIYFHCKIRKEMTELQVKNKLLESDKQMLVVSEQAIGEMRAIRHDVKNQLKVMELMLKEKRYKELEDYFASMNNTFTENNGSAFIDCGNKLINSIINMEILKANNYGIQLSTKINVPEELPFEPSDLCRVIVNLLDNAIEAVLRAKNKAYLIDCKIVKRAEYLYISVQNQVQDGVDREEVLKMNTEKEDAINHGFGHKIVKRISEKYNGYVNYSIEDGEFIAEIMLDMGSKQE